MLMLRRMISFLLVLTMLAGYFPAVTASAEETESIETTAAAEETVAVEEPSAPVEETVAATEPETEPSEETTAPTQEETEPVEPSAPAEETVPEETLPEETTAEETDSNEAMGATTGTCGENVTWSLSDGTLTISGTGGMADYRYGTSPWRSLRDDITALVVEEGITRIGNSAFESCWNLQSAQLPDSVLCIGNSAFEGCYNLPKIVLPQYLQEIEAFAFGSTALTGVNFPASLTEIGNYAFQSSDLTSVTVPKTITSIGTGVFDGCNYMTTVVIEDGVQSIGDYAFANCTVLTDVTFGQDIQEIGKHAFGSCKELTEVTIPAGVTQIREYTFSYCPKLESVNILGKVTSIGERAFYQCKNLPNVVLPDSVTTIGKDAFAYCEVLDNFVIPDAVTSIGESAFCECNSLQEIVIPEGVTTLNSDLFLGCRSLRSVKLPKGLKVLGDSVFFYCNGLTSLEIPDGVTTIGEMAFGYCEELATMEIPDSVTSIGKKAFVECLNLTTVKLPGQLTELSDGLFYSCDNLSTPEIPETVRTIGDQAFYCCKKISFQVPDRVISIGEYAFFGCDNMTVVDLPDSLQTIGAYAFQYCDGITQVHFPDSLLEIGSYAFQGCKALTSVVIPDGIARLDGVFSKCTSLTTATLPNGLQSLLATFDQCESLTSIDIPDTVKTIEPSAFNQCKSLTSVIIPGQVTSIGSRAFAYCTSLTAVHIPDSVTYIGNNAFEECENLTSVKIPGRVTTIGEYAFYNTGLTSVSIAKSVKTINRRAFSGSLNLVDVYYEGTEAEWKKIKIYNDYVLAGVDNYHYNTPMPLDVFYQLNVTPTLNRYYLESGEELELRFYLSQDGNPVYDWSSPTAITSSGSDILKIGEWVKSGSDWCVTIKAKGPGTEKLQILHPDSGRKVYLNITVKAGGITEYLNNQDIRINNAGAAYAYYRGDANQIYYYSHNGNRDFARSDDKGIIKILLGSYDAPGTYETSIVFTDVNNTPLEKVFPFKARVIVTPLEFTQQWVFSLSGSGGVSAGGFGVKLGSFEAEAALGKFSTGAGAGAAVTMLRTWKNGAVTLELVSDRSVSAEAGVESGITGKFEAAEVDLAHVSAGAEATGTVSYGLRIEKFSNKNDDHQKALAVFLLGEALRGAKNNRMAKSFYEKMREDVFDQSGIDLIEGTGAAAAGVFDAGFMALKLNDVSVFSMLSGKAEASTSISQYNYDNGDAKYSTSISTTQNLETLAGFSGEGILGMDYLGKDVTVEVQKEDGKKSLETTSLSSALHDISSVTMGKLYTQDYNQYVFAEDALDDLMKNTTNFRSYVNGSRIAVGNKDLEEMAQFLSTSEEPIAYNNREKTQMLYSLPLSFEVSLGAGVDVETEISYVQTVEHTTKSGYAVADDVLVTSTSGGNSAQVNANIVNLEKLFEDAIVSLVGSVAEFFKTVGGKIQEGVSTTWGWIKGKAESASDWVVSITTPNSDDNTGWNKSERVDVSRDLFFNSGWTRGSGRVQGIAATVGRPFVISVTEGEQEVNDLSSDPLTFTIRYTDSELQAAGVSAQALEEGELAMYRYDETLDRYECVGGTHDPAGRTVTAEIQEAGQYILAVYIETTSTEETPGEETPETGDPSAEIKPRHSVTIHQKDVILPQGERLQLTAETTLTEQENNIRWTTEDETVVQVEEQTGVVTAQHPGTTYVLATVSDGTMTLTDRCLVTVPESLALEGVQLNTSLVTTELFSTDYTTFEVLLQLPQNDTPEVSTYSLRNRGNSVAIEDIRFTNSTTAVAFDLVALDDRTVMILPTEYALEYPDEIQASYTSPITVTVQGEEYTTEELTITVKKTVPKLTATVDVFNSFYSGQSQTIKVAGATVTAVYADPSKAAAVPAWLTLEGNTLTLAEDAPLKSVSGKAYLLVETEEWAVPAAVVLNVKNTYKAPGLKLSASSVTMTTLTENSSGIGLALQCKTKTDTLEKLNVSGITAPEGYSVENFNVIDGSFALKAKENFTPGKITLTVHFSNTDVTVPLTLTVKTAEVKLKTDKSSLTLNTAVNDSAEIMLTATPADYLLSDVNTRLTDSTGKVDKSGELDVRYAEGKITIKTTEATAEKSTYKLYISAGGSREAVVTIKTISAVPTVGFKAKGNLDLSFPEQNVEITPTFKNYNGSFNVRSMTAESGKKEEAAKYFQTLRIGKTILVRCEENTPVGAYTLKLTLVLDNGSTVENTVKVTVKRTAVKLKLSASKLSLNKTVEEAGSVDVTCTTKGYDFRKPVWQLMDKSGKKSAYGKLDISWKNGKLTIGVNDATEYGATYKLLVKATEQDAAVTLTITIPARNKSAITASLKASGKQDVIRDGSAVTVMPSYKNCLAQTKRTEELFIYSSADNFKEPVNHLFQIEANGKGGYTITRAEGAQLDHSLKYKVKLVATFGEVKAESKQTAMSVTMGSAKLTMKTQGTTLFAKDKNDRAMFWFEAADTTLNEAVRVEIKDAKYKNLFEIIDYGDGLYAIGYKDGKVDESIVGKTITLNLNLFLDGNQTAKVNTTAKLKLTIVK